MNWATESNQDLILLLMDFDKAYDTLSWSFLFQTMKKMGFQDTWIKWIMSLHIEENAAVLINVVKGQTFNLQHSVRQGCSLAPYLFLIAANVIAFVLQDPKYELKGLKLPNGSTIFSQLFADDTLLFLEGSPENLDKVL